MGKEILTKSKGQIQYDWKAVQYIQSREQFIDWKQTMGGNRKPPQKRGPRECLDQFKATTMEEEDLKTEGRTKVTTKQVAERTWYTPEAWEHGGLRIKNEVKGEAGMDIDGATPSKRVKKEAAKQTVKTTCCFSPNKCSFCQGVQSTFFAFNDG